MVYGCSLVHWLVVYVCVHVCRWWLFSGGI